MVVQGEGYCATNHFLYFLTLSTFFHACLFALLPLTECPTLSSSHLALPPSLQASALILRQLCVPRSLPAAAVVVQPGPHSHSHTPSISPYAHHRLTASPLPALEPSSLPAATAAAAASSTAGLVDEHHSSSSSLAPLFLHNRVIVARSLLAHLPTALLYGPLMQLGPSPSHTLALATAVGSAGSSAITSAALDMRVALLLLLLAKCSAWPDALEEVGGDMFFR